MTYGHLAPEMVELMSLPRDERARLCYEDRWVAYPEARKFIAAMDDLFQQPRQNRPNNLLLVSRCGNGKSSILEHFVRRYPATSDAGGHPVLPVLSFEVPPDPTQSALYSQILWKMMRAHREKDSTIAKSRQTIAMLRQYQVRMLLIDEFNNIAEAGREARTLLNAVHSLTNELQLPVCAAGTSSAINALGQNAALKSRFSPWYLPPWDLDRSYLQFLAAYERVLPLAEPSGLATKEIATALHRLCDQAIGHTVKLLKMAAAHAVRSGQERITVQTLSEVHWVPQTRWSDVAALI